MLSVNSDLFLPIADSTFVIIFILTKKGTPEVACSNAGMLRSQLNTKNNIY
jgi:hypothetical protein